MFSALLSFLGGTAFRMLWGEISGYLNKRQDHKFEVERMRLQGEADAAQHARNLEAIKVQAELGVQTIRVAAEGEVDKITAAAWQSAVEATGRSTGIWFVDLWNGVIRPGLATVAIVAWVGGFVGWWALQEHDLTMIGAVLGIYVADRTLYKRGK